MDIGRERETLHVEPAVDPYAKPDELDTGPSALEKALGGSVGGTVTANDDGTARWACVCGAADEAVDEATAATTLYFHRRSEHRDVTVTMGGG